jgi:hypothetical protein
VAPPALTAATLAVGERLTVPSRASSAHFQYVSWTANCRLFLVLRSHEGIGPAHPLVSQLLSGAVALIQVIEAHAMQNIRSIRELNRSIVNNLDAISPRVTKVEERPRNLINARRLERPPSGFLIVNNETEMTTVIRWLFASLLQGYELIAEIDEGHILAFAAKLEFEETPIKGQCFFDVSNFQSYMV